MPRKPKPDVPKLTFHKSVGQWCKTFTLPSGKRKTVYLGKDAATAMQKYLAERDESQAGRNPRKERCGGIARVAHPGIPV